MAEKTGIEKRRERSLVPTRVSDLMEPWEREVENWFEDFWRHPFLGPWMPRAWRWRRLPTISSPTTDLYQEKDDLVVKMELPGLAKEDIEINLTGNMLTVRGEKKRSEETKEDDFYCCERSYGAFVRNIEMPAEVKWDKVRASLKDGILEIRLPKTEAARESSRKIKVE